MTFVTRRRTVNRMTGRTMKAARCRQHRAAAGHPVDPGERTRTREHDTLPRRHSPAATPAAPAPATHGGGVDAGRRVERHPPRAVTRIPGRDRRVLCWLAIAAALAGTAGTVILARTGRAWWWLAVLDACLAAGAFAALMALPGRRGDDSR